ncbi:Luc7-like protein 3 [Phlyctochytrium bullatum]|nr:Luc7-like protein 3 [Phlyctochytrium bullatum]
MRYQASADKGHLGWEQNFANFLTKLVNDMDRAIKKGKERISSNGPVGPDDPAAVMAAASEAEQEERIVFLEEQAKTLTKQMEEYGEMGEVEKAQELLVQVESLKQNIANIKNVCLPKFQLIR